MLKIFNELKPFFEDCYQERGIREYARLQRISAPTASRTLKHLAKEGLLLASKKGIYRYFRAHREGTLFRQLARAYWYARLAPLAKELDRQSSYARTVLFGSLAEAENTAESDADLFIDIERRDLDVSKLRNALGRDIQLHFRGSLENLELRANIERGVRLR